MMTSAPAAAYKRTNIMTSGKIRSMMLLLEKMLQEIPKIQAEGFNPHGPAAVRCQNIVAQLEMALNYKEGPSVEEIFDLLEAMYLCLSFPTAKSMRTCRYLARHYLETLRLIRMV